MFKKPNKKIIKKTHTDFKKKNKRKSKTKTKQKLIQNTK